MLLHVLSSFRNPLFFAILGVMAQVSPACAQDSSKFSRNPGPPGRADEINQLSLKSTRSSFSSPNRSTVSVRELKIPEKAANEYKRGIDLLTKQDPAGSLLHLNKAAAIFPGYYEAFYHIGVAEARLNHRDQALQALQKAIDLSDGRYAVAQFAYGLILCDQGNPEE